MNFNFDDLLLSLQDGVYFLDHDRRITFWNPAAERITGFSADDVVGSRCSDNILIHGDDVDALLRRADERTYRSKHAGKDRVTFAEE